LVEPADPGGIDPGREALLGVLVRHRVAFVLIGGAAIQSHGRRFDTQDIDLTPDVAPENLARLADALNELGCQLMTDPADAGSWVTLPADYFTPRSLLAARVWNLATRHGQLDLCFTPTGFPGGYHDLEPRATERTAAGTTVVVSVAALADVHESKRRADRPKDREYLRRTEEPKRP
jgi:hypothetical protein